MTLLSSIPKEKRLEIEKLIDKEIELVRKQIVLVNSMKEKLKKRIEFLKDIKNDRIPLESYVS